MTGTRRLKASKSSRLTAWPARRDIAIRCTTALVLQPMAIAQAMPFSKLARVSIFAGVRSSHTISTMRRPQSALMRMWLASAAGMLEAPGKLQAHRLGNAHHGGGRSHGHAGAMAAGDAGLHLGPGLLAQPAGAALVPVLEGVGTGAQHLALPVAAQHGAGRQVDEGNVHAQRAHHKAGRGLVAASHQHRPVYRVAAQQLFRFHREEVAVEHGGGLDHAFRKRNGRELERESTRLQHAALDVFHALLEVRVALVGVAPGVDDGDDRLAHPVGVAVAHLQHARAMAEGAEVVGREPAGAAKGFVGAFHQGCLQGALHHECRFAYRNPRIKTLIYQLGQ